MFPGAREDFEGSTWSSLASYTWNCLKPSVLCRKLSCLTHPASFILQHGLSAYWEVCVGSSVPVVQRPRVVVRQRQYPNIISHGAVKDKTKGVQQS